MLHAGNSRVNKTSSEKIQNKKEKANNKLIIKLQCTNKLLKTAPKRIPNLGAADKKGF